ncbi:MAG: hypothetical protein QM711_12815 [Micropruina sp.]|uniref:hypothetical protein n=1 Tax=Micropruina sp. TaxID=2737536 RepID=UPI0039E29476
MPALAGPVGGDLQCLAIVLHALSRRLRIGNTGHHVQERRADDAGHSGRRDRRAAMKSVRRPARAAMPRSPAAQSPGGMLKRACFRPARSRRSATSSAGKIVGKEIFHRLKAGIGRRLEAVEEGILVEHHA